MTSHKATLKTYKSDDEVKFGEDSILSTMNLETLKSGRQLRKDYRHNQRKSARNGEENPL